jgi:hypothetical protein
MRLVGDSTRSLWIVGDPNTGSGILSKQKDPQKSLANTSQAAKAGSPYKQGARARVTSGKANGRMLLAKDGRKPLVAGNSESDDPSDEQEDDADDDDNGNDNDGNEASEDEDEEDEEDVVVVGTEKPQAATHVVE